MKIPSTENGDCFFSKEKSLAVLNLNIVVLPLAVYTIVLEHVGLQLCIDINDREPSKDPTQTDENRNI